MLEGGDLLDGDLLLGGGVPGLHHGAVSALAQELGRLVAGSDLQPRCASGGGYQVDKCLLRILISKLKNTTAHCYSQDESL